MVLHSITYTICALDCDCVKKLILKACQTYQYNASQSVNQHENSRQRRAQHRRLTYARQVRRIKDLTRAIGDEISIAFYPALPTLQEVEEAVVLFEAAGPQYHHNFAEYTILDGTVLKRCLHGHLFPARPHPSTCLNTFLIYAIQRGKVVSNTKTTRPFETDSIGRP